MLKYLHPFSTKNVNTTIQLQEISWMTKLVIDGLVQCLNTFNFSWQTNIQYKYKKVSNILAMNQYFGVLANTIIYKKKRNANYILELYLNISFCNENWFTKTKRLQWYLVITFAVI